MKVSDYNLFVQETDQSNDLDVALYGIAGELGSVVSAVKRRLIAGGKDWSVPNNEIIEELGDLIWYCFAFTRCYCTQNDCRDLDVLTHDIVNLSKELGSGDKRAQRIGNVLGSDNLDEFLRCADNFSDRASAIHFDDYQKLAFLTARTGGKTLMEVCLAVLSQLCAELLRRVKLPKIETVLNQNLADRRVEDVLGEIIWHIAAIASLYNLSLDEVVETNVEKISFRYGRGHPTPLYDERDVIPQHEKLPRQLEICFVSTHPNRLQMYCQGRRLGDPLTDNNQSEDGYRFHDIFHLAFAAKLGWSPVLRKLFARKRKSDPNVDENEDGARARIVEEAVINAIHAEGVRQALSRSPSKSPNKLRLFANRSEISFDLLKLIKNFVRNNEVSKSRYWEWEDAIYDGCQVFHQMREEGQGTITVDLEQRTISFRPTVYVGLRGQVAVFGSATVHPTSSEPILRETLIKQAILDALGIAPFIEDNHAMIDIDETTEAGLSVKPHGHVRQAMWDKEVLEYCVTVSESEGRPLFCSVIGMTDLS